MKSFLTLVFLLLTLHTLLAQTCDEMLEAAKQSERRGKYFDAYQKYEAALTRCGDARKESIEKMQKAAVNQLEQSHLTEGVVIKV